MECPKCKSEIQKGDKFCRECGEKLPVLCPECGHSVNPQDKFCPSCGAKLERTTDKIIDIPRLEDMHTEMQRFIPQSLSQRMMAESSQMAGENRLITALFADISGFTALSNQNSPEQVVNIVNQCFKAIVDAVYHYEGSVNRFIGDNVLAFFGAPIAHENDPERSLLAALEMRETVLKLNLNISIGINSGFMYVGKIGVEEHVEYSAYGPEINLAKRLQDAANPGQILVGSGTYRFIRRAFDFQAAGPFYLKGINTPTTAYELLGQATHPQKLRGIDGLQSRFIGRDREFSVLTECAEAWLSGSGQMVSIIGEAGIGKSRLVRELREYLEREKAGEPESQKAGVLIMEGRCLSIGQPVSYWPFLDILRSYFNLTEDDNEREIGIKISESITGLFPTRYGEFLPFLGHLFSIKYGNEIDNRLGHLTPDQLYHLTMMRLRDIFVAMAQKRPLMLILEDLHWADSLSMDLLSSLMDALSSVQMMLVCVYRPEKEHRCGQLPNIASRKCPDLFTEINLKQFTPQESRRMVESLLSVENLPDNVKQLILAKSEGNPFFLEEMIRSLIDRDLIYRDGSRWLARQEIENLNVPETLQGLILERIDSLQKEVRYVLQCASVIGRLFRYRLLDYIARDAGKVEKHLEQLEKSELVYEERLIPELEYAFKHVLTQEATYQGMLEQQRKIFHLQVAQGIENLYKERIEDYYEQLSHHYKLGGKQEKALDYMLKSAEKAQKQYANDNAIDFYHQALDVMQNLGEEANPRRTNIYYALGRIYDMISKKDKAHEAYQKALELCTERRMKARIYLALNGTSEGKKKEEDYIQKAQEILGDDVNSPEVAMVCGALSWQYWKQGKPSLALKIVEQGLEIVKGTENYEEIVSLCGGASWYIKWYKEDPELSVSYARMAHEAAKRSGDPKLIATALILLIRSNPETEESRRIIQESIELNRQIQHWEQVLHGYCYLHIHYYDNNHLHPDPDKALEALQEGHRIAQKIEKSEDTEIQFWKGWLEHAAGRIYANHGKPIEAEKWYSDVIGDTKLDKTREFIIKGQIAQAYWNSGDHEKAKAVLAEAMSAFDKIPRVPGTDEKRIVVSSVLARQWLWVLKGAWIHDNIFPEETLKLTKGILNENPIPVNSRSLGRAYMMNGSFDEALEKFKAGFQDVPWVIKRKENWNWVIELAQKAPHLKGWQDFFQTMMDKAQNENEALKIIQETMEVWKQNLTK